jgi:hypothetical protein
MRIYSVLPRARRGAVGGADRPDRPSGTDRSTEYLAQAYSCHDMALRAEDARDRCALQAMTLIWEALAERAKAL